MPPRDHLAQALSGAQLALGVTCGGRAPVPRLRGGLTGGAWTLRRFAPEAVSALHVAGVCLRDGRPEAGPPPTGARGAGAGRAQSGLLDPVMEQIVARLRRPGVFEDFLRRQFSDSAADLAVVETDLNGPHGSARFRTVLLESAASARHDFLFQSDLGWDRVPPDLDLHLHHGGEDRIHPLPLIAALADRLPGARLHVHPQAGQLFHHDHLTRLLERMAAGMGDAMNAWKTRLAFGSPDLALSLLFATVNGWFLYYLVTIIGLPPLLAGAAFVFGRVLDGLLDPLIGAWADRHRRKPVDRAVAALRGGGVRGPVDRARAAARCAGRGRGDGGGLRGLRPRLHRRLRPRLAMMPTVVPGYDARTGQASVDMGFVFVAVLIASTAFPGVVAALGTGGALAASGPRVWMLVACGIAVLAVLAYLPFLFFIREPVRPSRHRAAPRVADGPRGPCGPAPVTGRPCHVAALRGNGS